MRQSAKALFMRAPKQPESKDWFAVRNVSDDEAEIDIYGEIGGWSWWDEDDNVTAQSLRKQLKDLTNKTRITVHINSPGGSVFEGLAIYNALKQHDADIKVVVDALAASAASFIAMAASPGQLVMARNAVMMIHDAATYAAGNADDMREIADLLDMHSDNIADIYSQRSGEDVSFWREAMKVETWYTGTEAVAAGLADSVLEDENKEAEKVAAKFDLSIYNYAGREAAPAPSVIHKRIKSMMNQAKESAVAKPTPKAHGDGTGTPPAEGETTTETVTTETTEPVVEEAPAEDAETVGADGDGQPVEGTQPPAEGTPAPGAEQTTGPSNSALTAVVINGATFQVPGPVATRLAALETVQVEAKEQGRKNFVASLATDNKIAATQITATEAFALDLSDDQYEKWVQTWSAAPANSLFAAHGEGTSNHAGTGSAPANEREAEIEKLEAIVAYHKQAGRPQAEIENTQSWRRLQQLKPSTNPS